MAYVRTTTRASWSEEALKEAATRVAAKEIGQREAERYYGIPARTIVRRINKGDFTKKALGPDGVLGSANEKRLVAHIQSLASAGFAPDRETVRVLAYKFAEKLGIHHTFSRNKEMAGYAWINAFLRRNPELSVRQSQGLSSNRGQGMNRKDVQDFFEILDKVIKENNLVNKPGSIFNVDETGFPLINKPGKVLTKKGAKNVHTITPKERGENVSLVGCCNAEGTFLPPILIMKGVNRKAEFSDGLPAGADVYMNKKSSYICSDLFLRWFKEIFVPRKPQGKTLLILDGHTSHTNALELLECAEKEGVIILCLPSHTTHALQPLDRSFFSPLKAYFYKEADSWLRSHGGRNITRYQAGYLIGAAWKKAASVGNAVAGFRACGIFPFNPNAIPEHFFSISDAALSNHETPSPSSSNTSAENSSEPEVCSPESQPGHSTPSTSKDSPSKHLHELSPIPAVPQSNKRFKQSAEILTSTARIKNLRAAKNGKKKPTACKRILQPTVNTTRSTQLPSHNNMKNSPVEDINNCTECWENYFCTSSNSDWIQCSKCSKWLHETCTLYQGLCITCGRASIREKNSKKQN